MNQRGYRGLVTRLGKSHEGLVRAWLARAGPSIAQGDSSCWELFVELRGRLMGEQKWRLGEQKWGLGDQGWGLGERWNVSVFGLRFVALPPSVFFPPLCLFSSFFK